MDCRPADNVGDAGVFHFSTAFPTSIKVFAMSSKKELDAVHHRGVLCDVHHRGG